MTGRRPMPRRAPGRGIVAAMARRRPVVPVLSLVVLLALAACSGDDDAPDPAADGATTTTVPTLDPDDVDADASPYCATWAEILAVPEAAETADGGEDPVVERNRTLLPLAERLADRAPEEIADAVEVALAATRARADEPGAPEPDDHVVREAQQRLAAYAVEHCTGTG